MTQEIVEQRLSSPQDSDIEFHPLAKRFNCLTPEQVLHAVEAGTRLCTGRFMILNSYENRVYQLELNDGSQVVAKFYRPGRWSLEAILDEHRFLQELFEEEIPVSLPLPLEITNHSTVGTIAGLYYALFERVGGRSPEEPHDDQLRILGRLLARIHNVGARARANHRPVLSPYYYGQANLDYLLQYKKLPAEVEKLYASSVTTLLSRMTALFDQVPNHRIHGDCHLNNLLWSPLGPTFLDFDDMVEGPAVQDIWLLAPSYDQEGHRQRQIISEAYAQLRDFDPFWLRLVEPLRALRFIRYATWIARRYDDPAFSKTFPDFGTLQYWQREVQDLREQIARIDHQFDQF